MKLEVNRFSLYVLALIGMNVNLGLCHPMIHKEPRQQGGQPQPQPQPRPMTTTPQTVQENFKLNKQAMTPSTNGTTKRVIPQPVAFRDNYLVENIKLSDPEIDSGPGANGVTFNVKAVNLAEKTLMQSNEEDDDDDDGGEYDGLAECDDGTKKKENLPKLKGKQNSVPMMIMREVDIMAMDIPLKQNGKKGCNHQEEHKECQHNDFDINSRDPNKDFPHKETCDLHKDWGGGNQETSFAHNDIEECNQSRKNTKNEDGVWGEWSQCSKTCGDGVQKRNRVRPTGIREKDTQTRICHVADCSVPDYRLKYRQY